MIGENDHACECSVCAERYSEIRRLRAAAQWRKCSETMPDDGDECLLYSDRAEKVVGPITYAADMGGWVDMWATKEAAQKENQQ